MLNGDRVVSAVVRNGDRIRVGDTEFVLIIEGDAAAANEPVVPGPPVLPAPCSIQGEAGYRADVCDSGMHRYSGSVAQMAEWTWLASCCRSRVLVAIVDFRRLNMSHPESRPGEAPAYLFDWLGEAAAENSRVVLGCGEVTPDCLGARWLAAELHRVLLLVLPKVKWWGTCENRPVQDLIKSLASAGPARLVPCWSDSAQAYVENLMQPFRLC